MRIFLKEFKHHMIDASRIDLSEAEELDLEFQKKGGDRLYKYLTFFLARDKWKDTKGYPIKDIYHENGYLACSISIRKMVEYLGYGNQKVQRLLNIMEELGWVRKDNGKVKNGQTVYILGTWHYIKDEDGKPIKIETLYRDEVREKYIKNTKIETYEEPNFDEMYNGDVRAYLGKV